MTPHCVAGFILFLSVAAQNEPPLAGKIKSFEDALKAAPMATVSAAPIYPNGQHLTIQDLDTMLSQGANEITIEGTINQLMTLYSSESVRQAGEILIQELELERKTHASEFEAKANAVLASVEETLPQAKKASDLDETLKDLQALQGPQAASFGYDTQILINHVNSTYQFVTQWQDYLSAAASGNSQDAKASLRNILNNRQIDYPTFFPRSEILARLEEVTSDHPSSLANGTEDPTAADTDPDPILAKIKTVDDVSSVWAELSRVKTVPSMQPWDWSGLLALEKARDNVLAGLPVSLDLKQAANGPVWGGDISRIEAMELLVLLPYYFGTEVSDPPKATETLDEYLNRLSTSSSANNDLLMLQRVISVKMALAGAPTSALSLGTPQFLAGLSQEAAGQYEPAVISYENALKNSDEYLPAKIVGDRLACIKATHPDDFENGIKTFLTPSPTESFPGMPPGMFPRMPFGHFGSPNGMTTSVLPIPNTISIPSRTTASPPSGTVTNMPPSSPDSH